MRRAAAILTLAVLLIFGATLPSFAYKDNMGRYVPDLPPFITMTGNQATINTYYNTEVSSGVREFFATLETAPYIVAVTQESIRGYRLEGSSYVSIGDDRSWWLIFAKPINDNGGFTFSTRYYDENYYYDNITDGLSEPLRAGGGFQTVSYFYNFATGELVGGALQTVNYFDFTYIVGSASLSNRVNPNYPYYNTLGNGGDTWTFYSDPDNAQKPDRHYDWWIGSTGVINNFEPDEPSEPDEPDDNYVPPGWTFPSDWLTPPSGTGSSSSLQVFDPFDPQYPGYVPPSDDVYDPLSGYVPPLMPDMPLEPGDTVSYDDPFVLGDTDGYSNPFVAGDAGSYSNPFVAGDAGSYSNPFVAGDDGGYGNPFVAGDPGSYSNPFVAGETGSYSNPFSLAVGDGLSDPFVSPDLPSASTNPFSVGSILAYISSFFGWLGG